LIKDITDIWDKVFLPKLKKGDLVRVKIGERKYRRFNGKEGLVFRNNKENSPFEVEVEFKGELYRIYFKREELTKLVKKVSK